MTFPIHISGQLKPPRQDGRSVKSVVETISSALFSEGASIDQINNNHIKFKRPFIFFEMNWKPLCFITKGEIKVNQIGNDILLNYKVSYRSLFVLALFMVILVGTLILPTSKSFVNSFVTLLTIWAVVIFLNLLFYYFLFRRFLIENITE